MKARKPQAGEHQPVPAPLNQALALAQVLAGGDIRPENFRSVASSIHALLTEARAALGGDEDAADDGSPTATDTAGAGPVAGVSAHVTTLAGFIASDAAIAREQLEDLIGNTVAGECSGMTGLVCIVSRMGMVADAITHAGGGMGWSRDPMHWVLGDNEARAALAALNGTVKS